MLTSLLAAELLTFNGTGVASHEAFLLEGGLHFGVVGDQGARNAKTDSAHLAGDATATSGDFDVPFFRVAEDGERKVGNHVLHFRMEVILEITTIDSALAGTRLQDHSGDSVLATASAAVDLLIFCGSDRFILRSKLQVYDFGFLGSERMFGASEDFKLLDHLVAKSAVREHAPNGSLKRSSRVLCQEVGKVNPTFTGDVTGVMEILLLESLVAGNSNLFSVNDNHEVASIDVRGIDGLVLAHEETSNFACNASHRLVSCVHKLPLAGDSLRVYRNGLHVNPLVSEIPGQRRPEKSKTNIDGFAAGFKGKKVVFYEKACNIRVLHSINYINYNNYYDQTRLYTIRNRHLEERIDERSSYIQHWILHFVQDKL